jgi:hypothetical protein
MVIGAVFEPIVFTGGGKVCDAAVFACADEVFTAAVLVVAWSV